jgi:hypothetical protein
MQDFIITMLCCKRVDTKTRHHGVQSVMMATALPRLTAAAAAYTAAAAAAAGTPVYAETTK